MVEHSGAESAAQGWIGVLPDGLAGLIVDGRDVAVNRAERQFLFAAESHRAARIGLGEIVHRVAVLRGNVHQAGIGTVSRRRPVRHALIGGRDQRATRIEILGGIAHGLALGVDALGPIRGFAELRGHQMFAGEAIQREEVTVAAGLQHQLARAAVELAIDQNRRLRRIPIVSIVRRGLVIPGDLAGFDVDGDDGTRIQVVAVAAGAGGVGRRRIAGADDVEMRVGIIRARHPHVAAAMPRGIEIGPGLQAGIALLHRHRIELPLHVAGFGIERLQVSRLVEIVAGTDQNVIADDDRRGRGEILQVEIGDIFVPDFLAGLGVQAQQNIVGRFHIQPVVPHRRGRDCRCGCRRASSKRNARSRGRRAHPWPTRCPGWKRR